MAKKQREVISAGDVVAVPAEATAADIPAPRFKQNPVARRAMRIYGAFWRQNPEHVSANESAFREQSAALAVDASYEALGPERVVAEVMKAARAAGAGIGNGETDGGA